MRLIDADEINFEEVFGGQSDFAKDIRESAQSLIDRQPTAFNKEKVIEELEENMNVVRETSGQAVTFMFSDGYCNGVEDSIKIIEKGGIE